MKGLETNHPDWNLLSAHPEPTVLQPKVGKLAVIRVKNEYGSGWYTEGCIKLYRITATTRNSITFGKRITIVDETEFYKRMRSIVNLYAFREWSRTPNIKRVYYTNSMRL